MGAQVAKAAAQMLKQRLCKAVVVVKVHWLVQNRVVARFAQVGVHGGNQPQRVVVEAGADIHIALFRQGLVLVVGASIGELGGGNVQNTLPRAGGDQMHKAEQILTGIAEAHAAAGAALIIAGRTAHVEGDHTLVLVPDIDHAVEFFIAAFDRVGGQQAVPVVVQPGKRRIDLRIRGIAGSHRPGAGLIDDAGRGPLLVLRVFDIAQNKNQAAAFAGLQGDIDLVYANGRPAMRHRVGAGTFFHYFGVGVAAPAAQKGIPAGVKAIYWRVDREKSIVVTALAVLCLVVDGAAFDLDLACRKIALEVGGIVHSIPQTELYIAEYSKRFRYITLVGQHQTINLAVVAYRHKQLQLRSQPVFFAGDDAVPEAVAALITVQLGLGGLPAGIPYGIAVLNIVIPTVRVRWYVIVAVAGDTPQLGIPVKAVPAGRVGNKAEECLTAQIVDPRQRRARRGDDIFACGIGKMTELHRDPLLTYGKQIKSSVQVEND